MYVLLPRTFLGNKRLGRCDQSHHPPTSGCVQEGPGRASVEGGSTGSCEHRWP
ncbi:mCG147957 [Mus musculus]|nr:mCG147957 [Mus musculus]